MAVNRISLIEFYPDLLILPALRSLLTSELYFALVRALLSQVGFQLQVVPINIANYETGNL